MKKILALILFIAAFTAHAQQPVNGLELPYGVKVLDTLATDAWYGPYPDVETALESVLPGARKNRTIKIDTLEYWWRDGNADEDLILKTSPGGGVDIGIVMDSITHAVDTLLSATQADSLYWKTVGTTELKENVTITSEAAINISSPNFSSISENLNIISGYSEFQFNELYFMDIEGSYGLWMDEFRVSIEKDLYLPQMDVPAPDYVLGIDPETKLVSPVYRPELPTVENGLTTTESPSIKLGGTLMDSTSLALYASGGGEGSVSRNGLYINANDRNINLNPTSSIGFGYKLDPVTPQYAGAFSLLFNNSDSKASIGQGNYDPINLVITGGEVGIDEESSSGGSVVIRAVQTDDVFGSGDIVLDPYNNLSIYKLAAPSSETYMLTIDDDGIVGSVEIPSGTISISQVMDSIYNSIDTLVSITQMMDSITNAIDTLSSGGSTNATAIRGVTVDASASSPSDGDILVYRNDDSAWVLESKPTGGGIEIAQVMDSITNAIDTLVSVSQMMDSIHNAIDTLGSGGGGSGTVTSVGLSVPTGFTVSGSPVTSSGTLTVGFDTGYQGYTSSEASKLSGIETGADVTDATNVAAAGAAMLSGATFSGPVAFTADATNAGLNIGSYAGDPSSAATGDLWVNSSTGRFMGRFPTNNRILVNSLSADFAGNRIPIIANADGRLTSTSTFTFISNVLSTPSISVSTGATLPAATTIGDVSDTEIGYIDGLTSSAQTQLDSKLPKASTASTGAVVAFDIPRTYGYSADITGNITLNSTGLVEGITQLMIHNDSSEPTFGSEFKIISGTYAANEDNYIMFHAVKSNLILVTISQEQ